jgi:hypothetical protein
MIENASFRNFKSLRHVDIDFERLSVVIGPNGSGKTSILEGLSLLARGVDSNPADVFSGQWRPPLAYTRGVYGQDLEISCSDSSLILRLKVPFFQSPVGQMHPPRALGDLDFWPASLEWVKRDLPHGEWREATKDGPFFVTREVQRLASFLHLAELFRLDATKLAEPSYSGQPKPRIGSDGEGLSSVLAFLALNQPERFASLQAYLRSIIPSVERIRFDRVPLLRVENEVVTIDGESIVRRLKKEYIGDEVLIDFRGASDVPAHLASEGTILVLGLLAALLGPVRPSLLLIDDMDRGLHPKAQRNRSILDEDRELQIIMTTHSPYIVDELQPAEVWVTWAGDDGITRCARLDKHPDLDRWKDEMWPGEFWSLVGEQWVANGQGSESR